jgi:prepilin-type N-terminal cleavage/methylation domain-containing protein/prepilin-type processing-associated H-X9-DG protein
MSRIRRAFTLIELLVVVSVIGLLIAILIPYLGRMRTSGKTLVCLTHLRELAKGWQAYADENDGIIAPGRMYDKGGGPANPDNYYEVGNGMKYRPRWAATIGAHVGLYAFDHPISFQDYNEPPEGVDTKLLFDRQSYDGEIYHCPEVAEWTNERNYAYGYNHQFLGNARQSNGRFHNFPVRFAGISNFGKTVLAADCLGTAAGFSRFDQGPYDPMGPTDDDDLNPFCRVGNHGWTLDPPRLGEESDRGTGDPGSSKTAVHPRHGGKVNAVFCDGHGMTMTDRELGYRRDEDGRYVDERIEELGLPHNRLFSGTGRDDLPPPKP